MDNYQVQSIYGAYCQYGSDYFVETYLIKTKPFSWTHGTLQDFMKTEKLLAPGRVPVAQENESVVCQAQ